jgi:hypothetical protein
MIRREPDNRDGVSEKAAYMSSGDERPRPLSQLRNVLRYIKGGRGCARDDAPLTDTIMPIARRAVFA